MAIFIDESKKTFYLESKDITYAFCVTELGFLNHLYYGKRIAREDLSHSVYLVDRGHNSYLPNSKTTQALNQYSNECPTYGRSDYRESMLAFCNEDGVRVDDWQYIGYELLKEKPKLQGMPSVKGKETLIVKLKSPLFGALVSLYYTVFEDLPVILRHVEIGNVGEKSFTLDRAFSFCVDMPDNKWQSIILPGAHLRERFIERKDLSHGSFSIGSKRGVSSGQMNPFLAIVRNYTTEDCGEAYGYNLVYSGDFCFKVESEQTDELRIVGGIQDYDFSWEVKPGENFVAPEVVMVYSDNGLGKMSRTFHDLYREYLINPRYVNAARPIVINNWEATYFNFNTKKLCDIIDSIEGTGIDTFVLDDGWFGVRNDDTSGLGDWFVNFDKLPQGLTPIIEHAHKKGLKFGLWFEPEMINENSKLYKEHPDWAIHADGLEPCPGRYQLVLDLTRPEVRDYIVESISKVLKENKIDYVKWDSNRPLTDNYSKHLNKNSKEMHHRYVLGLYEICERLVNGFPNIFFEGCSSGGCRFDPAMLYYFPQIWTSDNSDAYWRTVIQHGTSMCYPLSTMSCHVSACPNHQCGRITPLASRGHIAHLGATGYELDATKLSKAEINEITEQVTEYKQIQNLVLRGDLYRLNNPLDENLFAQEIVSKDKSKAFITAMRVLSVPNGACIRVYPKGLKEDALYHIPQLNITKHGNTLMNLGLIVNFPVGDFTTVTYTLLEK